LLVKEFKKWLKSHYKPNLGRSKDLRDKADKEIRKIEKVLKEN